MNDFDVIIIGAGVVGCSIARSLSRAGKRTLNLDALPACGYGSTSHSSAIIRPFYSHVTSCAIAHESRHRWLEWQSFLELTNEPLARYEEAGGLVLIRDNNIDEYAANLTAMEQVGVAFELLSASKLQQRYPSISLEAFGPPVRSEHERFGETVPGKITGGIAIPASGYVSDPQLATRNLQQAAIANGAEFRFNKKVSEVLIQGGISGVRCDDGQTIEAPILVNAAGPHSSTINALVNLHDENLRTRAMRHEVAYLKAVTDFQSGKAGFFVDPDCGFYCRPDGNDILIGSIDPTCDPHDVVDPDNYNREFTDQWTTQVHRAAQRIPDLGIENSARGTVGLYDVSDDWIPIYDATSVPGYYVAIGTSGNQFKNAPLIGDIMTTILQTPTGTKPVLHLDTVGLDVDLSFYSRLREVQSTNSVMA